MTKTKATKDHTVVSTNPVYMTKDYGFFKVMGANRNVDTIHVKQLQRLMLQNGNLTGEFPIIVDKEGYVVDGQHRLAALTEMGWEVGYRVEETATIETVRAINQGNRNWSWRDVADSYAKQGNQNYSWFLSFVDQYGLKFDPALMVVVNSSVGGGGLRATNSYRSRFFGGNLEILDKARAHDVGRQITEISRMVQLDNNDFTKSLATLMRSPHYDHERMLNKMRQQGETLPTKARVSEYNRLIEDIFNFGFSEGNRLRLF